MKIQKVTLNDINELLEIGRSTFTETYSSENTQENMRIYLESNFSIKNLKTELTNEDSEFYFAKQNNKTIGYLKVNFQQPKIKTKNKNALEIERIYVIKELQGQKIGQFLFKKAIEISKQRKVDFIWLGVWKKNLKAIQFYKKNGFIAFDTHTFYLGKEKQTDLLMKFKLN